MATNTKLFQAGFKKECHPPHLNLWRRARIALNRQCGKVDEQICPRVPQEQCHEFTEECKTVHYKEQCHSITKDVCNEVPKQHCVDVPSEHCKDVVNKLWNTVYTDNCKPISRDIFEDIPEVVEQQVSHEEVCKDVPMEECSVIPRKECATVPGTEYKNITEDVCDKPKEDCHDAINKPCNTFYIDNCRTVFRDVCREVPEDVCKDVLGEKCVDVPSEVCKYVTMAPLLTSPSMALFASNYEEDHGPSTAMFLPPILSSSMETHVTTTTHQTLLTSPSMAAVIEIQDPIADLIFSPPILSSSMETLLNSPSMFDKLEEEGAALRQDLEELHEGLGGLMEKHGVAGEVFDEKYELRKPVAKLAKAEWKYSVGFTTLDMSPCSSSHKVTTPSYLAIFMTKTCMPTSSPLEVKTTMGIMTLTP